MLRPGVAYPAISTLAIFTYLYIQLNLQTFKNKSHPAHPLHIP